VILRVPKALSFIVYGPPEPASGVVSIPGTFVALPADDDEAPVDGGSTEVSQ
jgi:hypothetical protein